MPDQTGTRQAVDDAQRGVNAAADEKRTPSLGEMLHRLLNKQGQSRTARTVEYFGWLDLSLGVLILTAPQFMAGLLRVQGLTPQSTNYIRLIGLLVSALGTVYVISGRLNSQGFSFASMLDRPLVPAIMAVLWWKHVLPGGMALAFSASDFGGFLWTLKTWRAMS